jgi:hypothetical protein
MRNILITMVAAVILSACGGDICTRIKDETNRAIGTCTTINKVDDTRMNKCTAAQPSCTADDKKKLDNYVTCLSKLSVCSPGSEAQFNQTANACYASSDIANLSAACLEAF